VIERVPVLRLGGDIIVSLQGDLEDTVALRLQDDLINEVADHPTRGVVIDISGLDVVDSFVGRVFGNLASMAKLLGSRVVLVGMRAEVAMTLVELGVLLDGIDTALNLERGIEVLKRSSDDAP